jgi:hypothetical protein
VETILHAAPYLLGAIILYGAYRIVFSGGLGQLIVFGGFMVYAAMLSWGANNSIFWAFVHGILGVFYVGYYYFIR